MGAPIPASCIPAGEAHRGLIYAAWLAELRDGLYGERYDSPDRLPPWAGRSWLAAAQHTLIDRLLARPGIEVLVAVNPGRLTQIFGYAVAWPQQRALIWIYTRGRFRRHGIAKTLLGELFDPEGGPIEVAQPTHRLAWFANTEFDLRPRPHVLCEAIQ